MNRFRSVTFLFVLVISTFLWGIMAILIARLAGRADLAHICGRMWGRWNLRAAGVKVRVKGLEHLVQGPAIYAANHQSMFDIFVVLAELPVQFRWLAKEELFGIPLFGQAMSSIGYIPINRSDRRQAFRSLEEAAERVRQGTSIVIFPEGTRSPDGVLQDFKKGGLILAIQSRQPVVPVSISGTYRILPKAQFFGIRPGRARLTIGEPIPTEGLEIKDRGVLLERVREAIRRHLPLREGGLALDGDMEE